MSRSHIRSNLPLHNRVCSLPEGGILFPFDSGLHGVDSAGNIIYPLDGAVATLRPGEGRFNGAVAVEESTTNLIPANMLNFEGWRAYRDATVKVSQGFSIPRITTRGATRIQTSGGSSYLKYYYGTDAGVAGTPASASAWVYNIGNTDLIVSHQFGSSSTIKPGEIIRHTSSTSSVNGTSSRQFRFQAKTADIDLDFIVYQPQIEEKAFPTSFVEGSRARGRLVYSSIPEKDITVNFWWRSPHILNLGTGDQSGYPAIIQLGEYSTTSRSLRLWLWAGGLMYFIGHHDGSGWMASGVVSTNGPLIPNNFYMVTIVLQGGKNLKFYLDGELGHERVLPLGLDSWGTNRLAIEPSSSAHNNAMYDDLMILPYAASDQEIQSWYHSNSRIHNNADTYITL